MNNIFFSTFSSDGCRRASRSLSETSLDNNSSTRRSRACSASSNIADLSADEEVQILRNEVLRLKLEIQPPSLETFEHDDESISLYTGFPSYEVARLVLDLANPGRNGMIASCHWSTWRFSDLICLYRLQHFRPIR